MQRKPGQEAVGGWLKDADSRMDRRHRRLSDIDPHMLNRDYLAYFEGYRNRYFNDRLLPGQGVEEIMRILSGYAGSVKIWADLGAGVTTLFWSIGIQRPYRVVACDLVPEALEVLARFREGSDIPRCYHEVMDLVGRTPEEFETGRRAEWDYRVFDCLTPWTLSGYEDGFDLMTAIGCFALAPDAARYNGAFQAARQNLRPGGRFVGADWVRSADFVAREGHDNRYVAASLTKDCGIEAGLDLLDMVHVNIRDDPCYDSVLVWAFSSRSPDP